jgi:hypothetical protein
VKTAFPFQSKNDQFLPGVLLVLCLFWVLWFVFSGLILIRAMFAGGLDFFDPHSWEVMAGCVGAVLAVLTLSAFARRISPRSR